MTQADPSLPLSSSRPALRITGTTKLLGVIGDPVQHSLSPVMHNAAIAQLGVDYVYLPLPVKPVDLGAAIAGFQAIGLCGFNITLPHKQAILKWLADISPPAMAIGAVNTVWWGHQGWQGTNTDVIGFLKPLPAQNWQGQEVLILGHGGSARAVVAACTELGCGKIHVVGRRSEGIDQFLQSWQMSSLQPPLVGHLWPDLAKVLGQVALVVNTTPIGMARQADATPLDEAQIQQLPAAAVVYDLIYTPRPTRLLQLAAQRGLQTQDGLEMLVQQGAAALEIWLGQPVPVATMRQAALQALSHIKHSTSIDVRV